MNRFALWLVSSSLIVLLSFSSFGQTSRIRPVYLTAWNNGTEQLRTFRWNSVTHIIYFCLVENGGTLTVDGGIPAMQQTIDSAHAHGKPILISLVGTTNLLPRIQSANVNAFIHSIVADWIYAYGFDGFDWDCETVQPEADVTRFMSRLRDSLTARGGGTKYISAYVGINPVDVAAYANSAAYMDWINMQSYDYSGPWEGWVTWHNGPLFDGGRTFPSTGGYPPSIAKSAKRWYDGGWPKSKICIGSSTGVIHWHGGNNAVQLGTGRATGGVALPYQTYSGSPWVNGDPEYYYAFKAYYGAYPELWDTVCQAPYVSINSTLNVDDQFITFDNGKAVAAKWKCVVDSSLGGLFIWDVGGAYFSNYPDAQRWPFQVALEYAVAGTPLPPAPTGTFAVDPDTLPMGGGNVTFTWTSTNAGAASISPTIGSVALNGNTTVFVSQVQTYTITFANVSGTAGYSAKVFVRGDSTNFAYGQNAFASTVESGAREAAAANDGRLDTRWSSIALGYSHPAPNEQQWWMVDLGTTQSVDSVTVNWEYAYASSYRIDYSLDSLSWSTAATVSLAQQGLKVTTFSPVNAKYIRIYCIARHSANSWGYSFWEVGVYGQALPSGQGRHDITIQATAPIAFVTQPTGSGNRNLEVIRDGNTPPAGSSDPAQQYDTYNGGAPRTLDWIGYQFPTTHTFSSMIFQEGMHFSNGGSFTSLNVQVRASGEWVNVQNLQCTPPYAGANGLGYEMYDLSFAPIAGDGIRISGIPGGSAHYVSVAELRVFDIATQIVTPPRPTIPRDYALLQNYPNPFNPTTKIEYNLPVGTDVSIVVYNILGQEIATLVKGYMDAGRHFAEFSGNNLTNGIYFYSVKAGNFSDMKKMVLLK